MKNVFRFLSSDTTKTIRSTFHGHWNQTRSEKLFLEKKMNTVIETCGTEFWIV